GRPVHRPVAADRPQRRPVRQLHRRVRRPARLPEGTEAGVTAAEPDPAAVTRRVDLLCTLDRAAEALPLLHRALAAHPEHADLWRPPAYLQTRPHPPPPAPPPPPPAPPP